MTTLFAPASTSRYLSGLHYPLVSLFRSTNINTNLPRFQSTLSTITISPTVSHSLVRRTLSARAASDEVDTQTVDEEELETTEGSTSAFSPTIDKELKKVAQKTAATFAPRASTASKNPAVPGSTLYTIFEVQGYASMLLGGALSFNLIFPSNEPDLWRLMGMWSVWMFTIPSLRARDCSKNEKEALNYLFLLVPLLNVVIPFFWKSFAVVWSADIIAFFGMYAWKVGFGEQTRGS